jgi:transaldolase
MSKLKIKLYADGAQLSDMLAAHNSGQVPGFKTNPTLMRVAGLTDYTAFAKLLQAGQRLRVGVRA